MGTYQGQQYTGKNKATVFFMQHKNTIRILNHVIIQALTEMYLRSLAAGLAKQAGSLLLSDRFIQ